MAKVEYYALNQSPLYGLRSRKKLADLIGIEISQVNLLLRLDNYKVWPMPRKRSEVIAGFPAPRKQRMIQEPKSIMYAVHKRLADLLSRIERPAYLYSATKTKSYVGNAKAHQNNFNAVKVDIKNFYGSVSRDRVKKFFEKDLHCAPDVAHLISRICCFNEALPTGSPLSPILSYFACQNMFNEISEHAAIAGINFTLYVDDMFFSGENAVKDFSLDIIRILKKNGFIGHKIAYFSPGAAKIITGVAVFQDRLAMPNKRSMRIRRFELTFARSLPYEDMRIIGSTLIGQYREGERVQPGLKSKAAHIENRLSVLLAERQATRRATQKRRLSLRRSSSTFNKLRQHLEAQSSA